jgi:hypothetical protein
MGFLFRKIPRQVIYFSLSNLKELTNKDPEVWHDMEHDIPPAGGLIFKEEWEEVEQLAVIMQAPDTSVEEISSVLRRFGFEIQSSRIENVQELQYGPKSFHFIRYKS